MQKRFFIILFCLFAVLLGVSIPYVQAHPNVVISGIEEDSSLYEWLDQAILDQYNSHGRREEGTYSGIEAETQKALRSKGYYDAETVFVEGENPVLEIEAGPRYTISDVKLRGIDGIEIRNLEAGEPLDAESVLQAQRTLGEDIQDEACPFNLTLGHEVILDYEARTGAVTFVVEAGEKAQFGTTRFEGAPNIDLEYLERFLRYEEGECWGYRKIERTKTALLGTGLVSVVRETLPEAPNADGSVDVVLELTERAPRHIRLGASYYTDEGPGILVEWIHRNFMGRGERVSTRLKANFLEQSWNNEFSKPHFLGENRTLNITNRIGRIDSDAFEEFSARAMIGIDNKFSSHLKGSLGLAVEATSITNKNTDDETTFGLFSTPARLTFDNRDNPLNPHHGWRIQALGEPFFDAFGQADPFVKTSLQASTYISFYEEDDRAMVLALRGRVGSLIGAGTGNTPASKRFYAGGGGSIRGFGYQEASPTVDGDPVGGRSLVETSAELRFRVSESTGGAVFVDGGGAYDSTYPDFKEGFYVGAGAGFRYFTDFGPIRADVAVPVNHRDKASSAFQFYISIGQAF